MTLKKREGDSNFTHYHTPIFLIKSSPINREFTKALESLNTSCKHDVFFIWLNHGMNLALYVSMQSFSHMS